MTHFFESRTYCISYLLLLLPGNLINALKIWLFGVAEQERYGCIVTALSTITAMNVSNTGSLSEMWSDGQLSAHEPKKSIHLTVPWLTIFQEQCCEKGLLIPRQACSFLFVNWNLNSAPPVLVADKIFFICWVSLGFWLRRIPYNANTYYSCHWVHKGCMFSSAWRLIMQRKTLETGSIPLHEPDAVMSVNHVMSGLWVHA